MILCITRIKQIHHLISYIPRECRYRYIYTQPPQHYNFPLHSVHISIRENRRKGRNSPINNTYTYLHRRRDEGNVEIIREMHRPPHQVCIPYMIRLVPKTPCHTYISPTINNLIPSPQPNRIFNARMYECTLLLMHWRIYVYMPYASKIVYIMHVYIRTTMMRIEEITLPHHNHSTIPFIPPITIANLHTSDNLLLHPHHTLYHITKMCINTGVHIGVGPKSEA